MEYYNSFCKSCGLWQNATTPCLQGSGDKTSNILVLGEAPGRSDDSLGQVFTDQAGKIVQLHLDMLCVTYYMSTAV